MTPLLIIAAALLAASALNAAIWFAVGFVAAARNPDGQPQGSWGWKAWYWFSEFFLGGYPGGSIHDTFEENYASSVLWFDGDKESFEERLRDYIKSVYNGRRSLESIRADERRGLSGYAVKRRRLRHDRTGHSVLVNVMPSEEAWDEKIAHIKAKHGWD